jgi:hypothetical protein
MVHHHNKPSCLQSSSYRLSQHNHADAPWISPAHSVPKSWQGKKVASSPAACSTDACTGSTGAGTSEPSLTDLLGDSSWLPMLWLSSGCKVFGRPVRLCSSPNEAPRAEAPSLPAAGEYRLGPEIMRLGLSRCSNLSCSLQKELVQTVHQCSGHQHKPLEAAEKSTTNLCAVAAWTVAKFSTLCSNDSCCCLTAASSLRRDCKRASVPPAIL